MASNKADILEWLVMEDNKGSNGLTVVPFKRGDMTLKGQLLICLSDGPLKLHMSTSAANIK